MLRFPRLTRCAWLEVTRLHPGKIQCKMYSPSQQLTEIRYVVLLYAQMGCSVLKKMRMGSEWIWPTRRAPAASDEVQEVCGSTVNDYESPLMGC